MRSYTCIACKVEFGTAKAIRKHIREEHDISHTQRSMSRPSKHFGNGESDTCHCIRDHYEVHDL